MPAYPRYYLDFEDPTGTDGERWATFRLSGGWAKRVKKGDVVFLANTKTKQVYGRAKVLEVHKGAMSVMLWHHAIFNHLELYTQPGGEAHAIDRRRASLVARYGPHKVREDSILTVLYLRRTA